MNDESRNNPEIQAEPTWSEKVVALSRAIALNYHREPRSTLDIDINVFLTPDDETQALR
jgi:hypothetical protein